MYGWNLDEFGESELVAAAAAAAALAWRAARADWDPMAG